MSICAKAFDRHGAVLALPVVVLLEEHGAEEADDRRLVGEDAHDVRAALSLLLHPGRPGRSVMDVLLADPLRDLSVSLSGAAFSTGSRRGRAQDGVWAGAKGCVLVCAVRFRALRLGAPKGWSALASTPSPRGTPAGGARGRRRSRAAGRLRSGGGGHAVRLAAQPDAVQRHGELARQGDLRPPETPPRREAHRPRLRRAPAPAVMDQRVGRLMEGASPARLIPPDRPVSPDRRRRGVRPKWAPTSRDLAKRCGSSMPAT